MRKKERHYLPSLRGPGSYNRLLGIAAVYNIDVALVDQRGKEEWDALIKSRVQEAAAAYMSRELEDRELPPAERRMQCRRYVRIGGCNAQYESTVPLGYAVPPPSTLGGPTGAAAAGCSAKAASLQQMRHMPEVASANCIYNGRRNTLLNTDQPKLTEAAQACATGCGAEVEREASRQREARLPPAITEQVLNLHWRRQSAATTKTVLALMRRMVLRGAKEDKRAAG